MTQPTQKSKIFLIKCSFTFSFLNLNLFIYYFLFGVCKWVIYKKFLKKMLNKHFFKQQKSFFTAR